jgi:hypothetical protein
LSTRAEPMFCLRITRMKRIKRQTVRLGVTDWMDGLEVGWKMEEGKWKRGIRLAALAGPAALRRRMRRSRLGACMVDS